MYNDLRFAIRQLRKSPGFTAVAVLTLALGIGANTAIFTLLDAVMLQTLPVKSPAQLALFYDGISQGVYTGNGFPADLFSYATWEFFRDHNESFQGLCAFRQGSDELMMRLVGSSESAAKEQAAGHLVSGNYFAVLGVEATVGRTLTADDDALAAPPVAVISYNFWRRRFDLDRSVVGKEVDLNGTVFTIVGVTPREFFGERVETPPDLWLPLARQPQVLQRESWLTRRDVYWLNLMGRLRTHVTLRQAQATVNAQLFQFYSEQAGKHLSAEREKQIREARVELKSGARGISWMRLVYSEPLHMLMAVVALVLLIACANVATLLLARASARRQELLTRLALGASRTRLIRQLLTESVVLGLFGGAAGVVLAWWGVRVLVVMVRVTSVVAVRPNFLVLCFTLGISILAGIGFGLVPALRSGSIAWRVSVKKSSGLRFWQFNPAHALVVLQVAVSSILLVGAGLLTHSLFVLEHQDIGFKPESILTVRTDPRLAGYQQSEILGLYRQIQEQLNALPGVVSASIAGYSPLSGTSISGSFSIEGHAPPAGREMNLYGVEVGPQFFETMAIPLLLGRGIGPRDTPASTRVAVVNESFVREFLPDQNPIGRRLSRGRPFQPPGVEIIGVAKDSMYYRLNEKTKPMAFLSAWQSKEWGSRELIIRTSGDPAGASAEVRRAIHEIDSRLPILRVRNLEDQVYESSHQERMIARFCSFFGLLALLLASIGLYGTMAYSVVRKTNEIGIRMALGAQRHHLLWMVLRESVLMVTLGLALGLPLALIATRWIKSFLFEISPLDPVALSSAIVLMATASTLAGYLPARRAASIDPMVALRCE
jgi:predicted permease